MLPYFASYVKFQRLVQISAEISVMPVTNGPRILQTFRLGAQIVRFQILKKARKMSICVLAHYIFTALV